MMNNLSKQTVQAQLLQLQAAEQQLETRLIDTLEALKANRREQVALYQAYFNEKVCV